MVHTPDPTLSALDDRLLLATVTYGEARGEPIEGQAGVINSILNRLHEGRWGPTLHRVILQWAQYSCLWPQLAGQLAFNNLLKFATALARNDTELPRSGYQILSLVDLALAGNLLDNTRGATHYYALTPQLIQSPPFWAKPPAVMTIQLGNQVFFRGVR